MMKRKRKEKKESADIKERRGDVWKTLHETMEVAKNAQYWLLHAYGKTYGKTKPQIYKGNNRQPQNKTMFLRKRDDEYGIVFIW